MFKKCLPNHNMASSDVLFCPQPEDIQVTFTWAFFHRHFWPCWINLSCAKQAAVWSCDYGWPVTNVHLSLEQLCVPNWYSAHVCAGDLRERRFYRSVCWALTTFVTSNCISLVSLVLFVLSNICCVLLFRRVHFQLFWESWLVTVDENTVFPSMLLQSIAVILWYCSLIL